MRRCRTRCQAPGSKGKPPVGVRRCQTGSSWRTRARYQRPDSESFWKPRLWVGIQGKVTASAMLPACGNSRYRRAALRGP